MKKTLILSFVLATFAIAFVGIAKAEDSASSSLRERAEQRREDLKEERREDRKELRMDIFKLQQANVVRQLNRALENLKQVRERMVARIAKAEQSGRNMTSAKALLVTADAKIAAAQTAIAAVATYVPPVATTTATSTATTTVASSTNPITNLDRPRVVAANAIKAVKDAKEALNDVVVAIAHSMGFKLGQTATSTATTTPPSTATSTATTTPPSNATSTATTTATTTNP
jgi:hypothetical protein